MRKRYPLNLLCIVSFTFVFAVFFSLSVEAGIVTDRFPLQMYAESQLDTYNNIGDARRAGWADGGTDLIRVTSINNGWLRVSHPGSGGRTVNRWCKANELFADPGYSNRGVNVRGAQTVYRTSTSGTKFGSVSNNESVIVLAEKNNRAQILYRLDNGTGYKVGWVPLSAVQSTRNVPGSTSNPIVQPATRPAGDSYATINGDYYLVPEANSGFALDVAGGGQAPEQTILQLYHKNNTDAQIFHIQPVSGQWHIIQHKRTGHVANVQWGNANSGTGLWLYHHDGTASCHWRFIKQNNGSYLIQSQLNGNPIMELQNNSVYAGGRIQLWARHTGQAGRWKLVPVGQGNTGAKTYIYPMDGYYLLTTLFYYNGVQRSMGYRHSVWWNRDSGGHFNALDIACNNGTRVKAVASGTVIDPGGISASDKRHIIVIQHDDGMRSLYAHLRNKYVNVGARVLSGQEIGEASDIGIGGGAYHLHLEFSNCSPWEYYRDKVPFKYCKSTLSAYNNRCLPQDKQRFGEAVKWVQENATRTGGFVY